ncbi:hypothetical protein [Luteimonas mephitis]|uniref:hypothetical protein n=1 Tax=Luteimonas mephitis TaxID=83615 RepID=UPI003A8D77BF
MTARSIVLPRGPVTGRAAFVVAAALAVLGGCRGGADVRPADTVEPDPVDGGAFTVAESMLDTWNTIGKILVRLDGVGYERRAQMLGLYVVRYRDERFLIRTRALVIEAPGQGLRTRVDALGPQGQAIRSAAAADLLQVLARRVPLEVALYRQPVKLPPAGKSKSRPL